MPFYIYANIYTIYNKLLSLIYPFTGIFNINNYLEGT